MTILAAAGVLVVFNILFYLWTDSDRSAVCWISYGFITLSYVIFVLTYFFPRKGRGETYSLVVPQIAITYMALNLCLGIILMILTSNITIALTLELLLSLYYIAHIVIHVQANRRTAANETARKAKVSEIRQISSQLKLYIDLNEISDPEALKTMNTLYDEVQCSPTRTYIGIDFDDVAAKLAIIDDAISSKDWVKVTSIARQMQRIVRQRNIS